mgnify:FL=1
MPKILISIQGRQSSNWDIDVEQTDQPQLTISSGSEELNLSFSAEQYRNYYNGLKSVAYDEDGREVVCRSFGRK